MPDNRALPFWPKPPPAASKARHEIVTRKMSTLSPIFVSPFLSLACHEAVYAQRIQSLISDTIRGIHSAKIDMPLDLIPARANSAAERVRSRVRWASVAKVSFDQLS